MQRTGTSLRRNRVPPRAPGRAEDHPQVRRERCDGGVRADPPARHAREVPGQVQAPGARGHDDGPQGGDGGGPRGGREASAHRRDAAAVAMLQPYGLRGRGAQGHEEDGVGVLL